MTWYCAHIIIGMHKKGDNQSPIDVYENIVLLEASSFEDAKQKAEILGKEDAALDDGLTIGSAPAVRVFAGVRKVVSIVNEQPPMDEVPPSHGSEVTYSEFQVPNMDVLMRLGNGETVDLRYLK